MKIGRPVSFLIAQATSAALFFAVAQVSHRSLILTLCYYGVLGFGAVALFLGVDAAVKTATVRPLAASVVAVLVYVVLQVYAFACCARWGA